MADVEGEDRDQQADQVEHREERDLPAPVLGPEVAPGQQPVAQVGHDHRHADRRDLGEHGVPDDRLLAEPVERADVGHVAGGADRDEREHLAAGHGKSRHGSTIPRGT